MNFLQEHMGRIFAYRSPVDMRKGFRGLEGLIRGGLGNDPLSGDMFVFINRDGKHIKCFVWDRTGYVIIAKRLERGRVQLRGSHEKLELDVIRLQLLMDGMSVGGIPAKA